MTGSDGVIRGASGGHDTAFASYVYGDLHA